MIVSVKGLYPEIGRFSLPPGLDVEQAKLSLGIILLRSAAFVQCFVLLLEHEDVPLFWADEWSEPCVSNCFTCMYVIMSMFVLAEVYRLLL